MYSNTLGYIKCQTYIEVPYLFYNYYIFFTFEKYLLIISQRMEWSSLYFLHGIFYSVVLLKGQRQNSWDHVVLTIDGLKKNVFCIEWSYCFNESWAVEFRIKRDLDGHFGFGEAYLQINILWTI